jgi:hypothetical protein
MSEYTGVISDNERLTLEAVKRLAGDPCLHGMMAAAYCHTCLKGEKRIIALEERLHKMENAAAALAVRMADLTETREADPYRA